MNVAATTIPGEMMEQLRYIEVHTVKAARDHGFPNWYLDRLGSFRRQP